MIRLCYPHQKVEDRELVHFVTNTLISNLQPKNDLVLVSDELNEECKSYISSRSTTNSMDRHFLSFLESKSIVSAEYIDIEKVMDQPLQNIVLINFDSMDSSILKCLVNKSKKTEIIGVSNNHTDYFSKLLNEVYHYKYNGFSNDQIIVLMSLEYNCPPVMISKCLDNVKLNESNIKLRTVEYIEDIIPYLKH